MRQPPIASRQPKTTELHGATLTDDYAWMRNKDSEQVLDYLRAENEYTAEAMAGTDALQAELYREMLSHIKETDESVPYRDSGWFYYTRTEQGLQYPLHCRRAATRPVYEVSAAEEVLLDVNELARGQPFMAVGSAAISPDGMLLAYATDNTGFRQYTLRIRNLRTGEDMADSAARVGSIAWAADSRTLFYTTEDEVTKRQDRLYRHALGSSSADDTLVFEEADERFNLGVGRTRDRRYLLLESSSHTTNEYRCLPSHQPESKFQLLAERVDEQEYYPDHRAGFFFLRTNDTGKDFRMVTAPVVTPGREAWRELIPQIVGSPLEDFDLFASFCVVTRREKGLPTLTVWQLDSANQLSDAAEIPFPEPTYSAHSDVNREFDTTVFRYNYQSLVAPPSVFAYDLPTRTSTLLKQQDVPGGFDVSRYGSERLWVSSPDGVEIPVSLVYRRDRFRRDQTNCLYVYGYGSYGYPLPVGFSPTRLSLLDRGVVLAYAHIRGGGELGDTWHDAGRMSVKQNTFDDFIRVVEDLTARGYGDPARVAIEGGSAGGLLLGAVVNMRPDLFRVVLSHVPFVDVMNTMLDASLPLTVAEYEEWGNPNEPEAFRTMYAYSPYDNLKPGEYPAMLVKTSLNDSQVMYWEPAKYVAKLRTLKTNATPLLLHINMEAGHGGASGRYDYLKEIAFDYSFLLIELDLEERVAEEGR